MTESREVRKASDAPPPQAEIKAPMGAQVTDAPEPDVEAPARGGLSIAIIAVVGPLALGIVGIVLSARLGLGELNSPGPGLWPMIISVFLTVVSLAGMFGVRRDTDVEAWGSGYLAIGLGLASLVAYAFLFERIGFEVPTLILLFFWIKVLGRESWRTAVLVSVIATAAAYALFILALRVNIPHLL